MYQQFLLSHEEQDVFMKLKCQTDRLLFIAVGTRLDVGSFCRASMGTSSHCDETIIEIKLYNHLLTFLRRFGVHAEGKAEGQPQNHKKHKTLHFCGKRRQNSESVNLRRWAARVKKWLPQWLPLSNTEHLFDFSHFGRVLQSRKSQELTFFYDLSSTKCMELPSLFGLNFAFSLKNNDSTFPRTDVRIRKVERFTHP